MAADPKEASQLSRCCASVSLRAAPGVSFLLRWVGKALLVLANCDLVGLQLVGAACLCARLTCVVSVGASLAAVVPSACALVCPVSGRGSGWAQQLRGVFASLWRLVSVLVVE